MSNSFWYCQVWFIPSGITGGVDLNANGDREQKYMVTHMQDTATGSVQVSRRKNPSPLYLAKFRFL